MKNMKSLNNNNKEGKFFFWHLILAFFGSWFIVKEGVAECDAPESGQILFQDPASPIMEGLIDVHHDLMFFLIFIFFFVSVMLYDIIDRYFPTRSRLAVNGEDYTVNYWDIFQYKYPLVKSFLNFEPRYANTIYNLDSMVSFLTKYQPVLRYGALSIRYRKVDPYSGHVEYSGRDFYNLERIDTSDPKVRSYGDSFIAKMEVVNQLNALIDKDVDLGDDFAPGTPNHYRFQQFLKRIPNNFIWRFAFLSRKYNLLYFSKFIISPEKFFYIYLPFLFNPLFWQGSSNYYNNKFYTRNKFYVRDFFNFFYNNSNIKNSNFNWVSGNTELDPLNSYFLYFFSGQNSFFKFNSKQVSNVNSNVFSDIFMWRVYSPSFYSFDYIVDLNSVDVFTEVLDELKADVTDNSHFFMDLDKFSKVSDILAKPSNATHFKALYGNTRIGGVAHNKDASLNFLTKYEVARSSYTDVFKDYLNEFNPYNFANLHFTAFDKHSFNLFGSYFYDNLFPTYDVFYVPFFQGRKKRAAEYALRFDYNLNGLGRLNYVFRLRSILQVRTHITLLEFFWTVIPAYILLIIAIPSFILLYSMDAMVWLPHITLKVVGYQWFWTVEYGDIYFGQLALTYSRLLWENMTRHVKFKVSMAETFKKIDTVGFNLGYNDKTLYNGMKSLAGDSLNLGVFRLLDVDNRVVVPARVHIRVLVTGGDVIHSLAVPSLGIKVDACPGRLNQVPVYIKRLGTYYGQCSEICGVNHGFMPFVITAVSLHDYAVWYLYRSWGAVKGSSFFNSVDYVIFSSVDADESNFFFF